MQNDEWQACSATLTGDPMKLLTFRPARARTGYFGVLLAGNRVLDVTALAGRKLPATVLECIQKRDSALAAVQAAAADAEAALARGEQLPQVFALDAVTLEAPLIPGKIMAVGKNYADHAAEGSGQTYTRVAGFVKVSSCVVPHGATIRKPAWSDTFDYENELAIVIGRECSKPSARKATSASARISRPRRHSAPGSSPRTRSPTRTICAWSRASTAKC